MKKIFTLFLTLTTLLSFAQTTADFENYNLQVDSLLNGSDGNNLFNSGNVSLFNEYFPGWNGWGGWAISSSTDVTTAGYTNDFSAITGAGVDNSLTYAVTYASTGSIMKLENDAQGEVVNGMYITNGTYAFLSMTDGDGIAKKFGGATGDDEDYFLLTIKKYFGGTLSTDSVNFYLADYRFSDNSQDYIVNEWTWVDLTSLGQADSLAFSMSSTDVGNYGMNTPAYFAVDNVVTSDGLVAVENVEANSLFEIYPNPASDFFILKNLENENTEVAIFDMTGKLIYNNILTDYQNEINIQNLAKGTYMVKVQTETKVASQLLIKQ
ncbi:MAG: DUF4465 domain-containing protein [Saprospiraceae bacterium]